MVSRGSIRKRDNIHIYYISSRGILVWFSLRFDISVFQSDPFSDSPQNESLAARESIDISRREGSGSLLKAGHMIVT